MIFRYRWMDLQAIPPLAASQDQFLHQLRKRHLKSTEQAHDMLRENTL